MGPSQRWLHFEIEIWYCWPEVGFPSVGKSLSSDMNGQLLSFSRKKAVMHCMENCRTLLGGYQPETCIRAYAISKRILTEVGMCGWKQRADKQPRCGCWRPGGICDMGILRPPYCASLQGVCTSFPAFKCSKFMSYTSGSSWEWVLFSLLFFCFYIVGCVVMFMSF